MKSCVAVITAALRNAFNDRAAQAGGGPNNYSVPLSPPAPNPPFTVACMTGSRMM